MPVHADEKGKFKVGAVLALTGPVSIAGISFKNAMTLSKLHHDKKGQIELVFEDDEFLPRKTVTAVQKLLREGVDALVIFGTNQGLAVVNVTEQNKVPLLSLNVNRSVVKDRNYSVLVMPSVEALTSVNVREVKRRGYKRIATVASMQDSCLLQQEILENSVIAKIVGSYEVQPTERDFREIASRLIGRKPDAVFISTLPPQGSLIAKRLRQLGFKGEFFGGIQSAHLAELKASDGALVGSWVVSGDNRQAKWFYEQYHKRFNEEPNHMAMYAYDAIQLIVAGLKTGDLNKYLHTVNDFNGVVGNYSADGNNGFDFEVAALQFTENGYLYLNP